MTLYLSLLGAILCATVAATVFLYRRSTGSTGWLRACLCLCPLLLGLGAANCLTRCLHAPFTDWNVVRLTLSFALVQGVNIFSLPGQGPLLSSIYGPVGPLSFTPATLAASPTGALLIAGGLAQLYYLVPMLFLFRQGPDGSQRKKRWVILAAMCFLGFTVLQKGSTFQMFNVHVDASALGCAAMACYFILRRKNPEAWGRLLGAAVFLTLSVSAKQVAAPLLLALPLYVFVVDGWRAVLRFLACLLGVGILALALAHFFFGLPAMWFNMVASVSQQTNVRSVSGALLQVLLELSWVLLGVILGCVAGSGRWRFREQTFRDWCRANPWVLCLWCGAWLVPTSVRGLMVLGGTMNSVYCLYFLTGAFALLLVENAFETKRFWLAAGLRFALIAFTVASLGVNLWKWQGSMAEELPGYFDNPREQSFRYVRAHPGEAYFPWETLSTAMAERRIYHTDYGPYDLQLAGVSVTRDQIAAGFPQKMRLIAFRSTQRLRLAMQFFPELSVGAKLPELPGFDVYVAPGTLQAEPRGNADVKQNMGG